MNQFDAVILDMDGTLVNTEKLWKQAESSMLTTFDRRYDTVIHAQFLGLAVPDFIPAVQKAYDLEHVDHQLMMNELEKQVLRLLETETQPTEGAQALIQYIHEEGIRCAIASNSSHTMIDATLKNQRWLDVIQKRFSSDDVVKAKPAPDLYLHVAEKLGVEPEKCLAVEDSLAGVKAAVNAGMVCFAVPDHHLADVESYRQWTPYIAESLVDVLVYLQS